MSARPASGAGGGATPAPGAHDDEREPPPILGTWPRVYGLVVAELVVVIGLLYLLTRRFS